MAKSKKSGSAIFMYCVIGVAVAVSVVCFTLYLANVSKNAVILWTGIVAFTIMYHLWMRLIMGNVNKLFNIKYTQWWFKERAFEKKLYKFLRVKKWKGKALTYNPELYSVKDNSFEDIASTTAKSETDHWINELISLSTVLFSIWWGAFWIFFVTAIIAMLFDAQFIVIQRYNRPRLVRMIEREKKRLVTV